MATNMKKTVGNKKKANRYASAFQRIKNALEYGFPFEAIAIEESVISDRLQSICANNALYRDDQLKTIKQGKCVGLSNLVDLVNTDKEKCGGSNGKGLQELAELLVSAKFWSRRRNEALHNFVRTKKSGRAPECSDEGALMRVKATAWWGWYLANAISALSKKTKRRPAKAKSV